MEFKESHSILITPMDQPYKRNSSEQMASYNKDTTGCSRITVNPFKLVSTKFGEWPPDMFWGPLNLAS